MVSRDRSSAATPIYVIDENIQATLSLEELDKLKVYCLNELQCDYDKEMSAATLHNRAIVNGTMYHSILYNCKATKRNNYTAAYQLNEQVQFGIIKSFLSVTLSSKSSPVILCVIKTLRECPSRVTSASSMEDEYISKTFQGPVWK